MSSSSDNSTERKIEIKHTKTSDLYHSVPRKETLYESDQKYFWLIMNIPEVIWTTDRKGRKAFISQNIEEVYVYSSEEIYKQGDKLWFGRIHPDDVGKVKKAYEALFEKGTPFDVEYRIKRKDGKWIWLHERSTASCEIHGVKYADGIFSDVNGHKRLEKELKESEQRFRSIFDNAADGILLADAEDRRFHSGNKMICQMLGYTAEEIKNLKVMDIHPKENLPYVIEQFERQACGEFTLAKDIPVKRKDGTAFTTYASVTLLRGDNGKTVGTLAVVRDIAESKRREKELNSYRQRMARAEKLASIGSLSTTMAHELTQPLMVITLSIEKALAKLEKTSCPEAVKDGLKDALSGVSRAVSIVKGFRNYAKRYPQKITKEVNLKAIAERTIRLLSDSARRAKVTLNLNNMDKLPNIYSVEEDLEQLFFALAQNAIEAADGKRKRQLVISGAARDQYVKLEFSDDCGGIAPENLDMIFEPFFTRKPVGEGTGLGLCIVQNIVSRAGGQIRVKSKVGKGSTFYITLPINRKQDSLTE
jgi:PAS domain S-box-containing protein